MRQYESTIPTRYALPLIQELRKQKPGWLEALLIDAGLSEGLLRNTTATLTIERFGALLDALSHQTGRDDLGFDLGRRITLHDHGALLAVLRRGRTLEDMLRTLARYSSLITPSFFLHYRRTEEGGDFIWRPATAMSTWTLRVVVEIVAVSFHVQVMSVLPQKFSRYDIYLSTPAPRYAVKYRDLRPAIFHFGHLPLPEIRITFSAEQLQSPVHWPELMQATGAENAASGVDDVPVPQETWSAWVGMMLREAEGTQPSLGQLAELLSVSPRTLTRYLAAEGCTLRDMANDIRYQRAYEMLADKRQTIAEIAWRLGYTNSTNFTHAFRTMAGVSPREFRAFLKTFDPTNGS